MSGGKTIKLPKNAACEDEHEDVAIIDVRTKDDHRALKNQPIVGPRS